MRNWWRKIWTLAFIGLLGGCGTGIEIAKIDQLPPETRAAMAEVALFNEHRPKDLRYKVLSSVESLSCRHFAWDPAPTLNDSLEQLKYKAIQAGGNAVIGVSCTRTGVDYGTNCFKSVICEGTAVQASDSAAVTYLPEPRAKPDRPAPTPPTPGSLQESEGHAYALVIGNDDYHHVTPLKTAVKDAKAVGKLLNEKYGFRTTIVTNATRGAMLGALDEFRAKLGPADSLLIYYAGHGWLDAAAERGFWIPVDAAAGNRANWLSNADISDTLKAIRARHVMVVADSCYSGTLTRNAVRGIQVGAGTAERFAQMRGLRSRTALTSGGLEPVLDGGGDGHSVFARAFLTILQKNNTTLDGTGVFQAIRHRVRLNAEQTPQYANIRFTGHQVGADFIFQPIASGSGKTGS